MATLNFSFETGEQGEVDRIFNKANLWVETENDFYLFGDLISASWLIEIGFCIVGSNLEAIIEKIIFRYCGGSCEIVYFTDHDAENIISTDVKTKQEFIDLVFRLTGKEIK